MTWTSLAYPVCRRQVQSSRAVLGSHSGTSGQLCLHEEFCISNKMLQEGSLPHHPLVSCVVYLSGRFLRSEVQPNGDDFVCMHSSKGGSSSTASTTIATRPTPLLLKGGFCFVMFLLGREQFACRVALFEAWT